MELKYHSTMHWIKLQYFCCQELWLKLLIIYLLQFFMCRKSYLQRKSAISTGRSYLFTCGSIKHQLSRLWQIVAADCTAALIMCLALVGSWHTQGGLLLPPPRPDYIYLLVLILSQSSRDKLYIVRVPGQTLTTCSISCRLLNKPIRR